MIRALVQNDSGLCSISESVWWNADGFLMIGHVPLADTGEAREVMGWGDLDGPSRVYRPENGATWCVILPIEG